MTIDERIERLTARHEALTMNMELASLDWNDRHKKLTADIAALTSATLQLTAAATTLTDTVHEHEHRIQKLEGKA